ncbi:MAG: ligase-associated DNA damage response endonuclease PdeM [Hyphomicrobiaceae bacterium]
MRQAVSIRGDSGESRVHFIPICGQTFVADVSGALFWPNKRTLVIADLHLEKGSAFAAKGQLLPPYDTRETLSRLTTVIDKFDARTVISLGDSFHDVEALSRMAGDDLRRLEALLEHRNWIWVSGNHDARSAGQLGGDMTDKLEIGNLVFRHEPQREKIAYEVAGHLHPAAKMSIRGHGVRRPCFVGNGRRLVLPAFGSFAGGLNVLNSAFDCLFGADGFTVWMRGDRSLFPVSRRLLRPDRSA